MDNLLIEMSKRRDACSLLYDIFGFLTDTDNETIMTDLIVLDRLGGIIC